MEQHLIKFLTSCKTIMLSLITWISLLIWLPFFAIYRTMIDIILRIRHGESYGGLLSLRDSFFLIPDVSKCSMIAVIYVKSDWEINLFEVMKKVYQEKVFNDPGSYPKLTSAKHDFGGYPYWMKNGVSVDDTIIPLEVPRNTVLTEEYLKELTGELSKKEYPKDEAVLWEVHVSEKSLDNNNVGTCYRYPIIVRVHHSICDGTSVIALFIRLFGDASSQNYSEELFNRLFKANAGGKNVRSIGEIIKMSLVNFIKTIRLWLDLVFAAPGRAVEELHLKPLDQNALHNIPSSGEKIAAWTVEEHVECIPLIKRIRRETNSKFMSVVCAAASASTADYFKRNSYPIPDYTSVILPQLISFPSIDPSKPVQLENKATLSFIALPTNSVPHTLLETLKQIDESMKQDVHYSNGLISSFFLYLFGIIPNKVLSSIDFGPDGQTLAISNVPGGSQINVLDGCVFENVVGMAPNMKGVGVTLTLLSYDNKLQIGILVDKSITKSQKEVQRIADDILYYIKVMDKEVGKIYGESSSSL